jgi:hypothetical protein
MSPVEVLHLSLWVATGVCAWCGLVCAVLCLFAGAQPYHHGEHALARSLSFFAVLSLTLAIVATWV